MSQPAFRGCRNIALSNSRSSVSRCGFGIGSRVALSRALSRLPGERRDANGRTARGANHEYDDEKYLHQYRGEPKSGETAHAPAKDQTPKTMAPSDKAPGNSGSSVPFAVGERVRVSLGGECVITRIDPEAEHGLGVITGRRDDGTVISFALIAHGFSPLSQKPAPVEVKKRRSIQIFLGEDRIVMRPSHNFKGKHGPGHYCGLPVTRIAHESTMNEVLAAIEQTLSQCQENAPEPADYKAEMQPLLKATGEKTWNAITRSFALVSVIESEGELLFTALAPEKGAFLGTGKSWTCKAADREAMASTFRAAAAVAMEAQNLHSPPPLA
jgi:hypothetical protein